MVGIECKSCGHRALWEGDPARFPFDHEVIAMLTRSPLTCSNCGASEIHVVSGNLATSDWLSDGRPLPEQTPLIGGGTKR